MTDSENSENNPDFVPRFGEQGKTLKTKLYIPDCLQKLVYQ